MAVQGEIDTSNPGVVAAACVKIRGHYGYYGVTDYSSGIARSGHAAGKLLMKWLTAAAGNDG